MNRNKVRKLLKQTSDSEISITCLSGDGMRLDIAPQADTPEEGAQWKDALKKAKGT